MINRFPGEIKIGFIRTSRLEIIELLKAWSIISIAFAIVMSGLKSLMQPGVLFYAIMLSAFTVGTGFLLHELAHKLVAQNYGAWAEFRAFDQMLLLALLMSFVGFVFAAPGAVFIHGHLSARKNGIVSVAGPLTNLALAILFVVAGFFLPINKAFVSYGFMINTWLAVFNMIPFWNFDGKKIIAWSKPAYFLTLALGLALMFAGYKFAI